MMDPSGEGEAQLVCEQDMIAAMERDHRDEDAKQCYEEFLAETRPEAVGKEKRAGVFSLRKRKTETKTPDPKAQGPVAAASVLDVEVAQMFVRASPGPALRPPLAEVILIPACDRREVDPLLVDSRWPRPCVHSSCVLRCRSRCRPAC